MAEEHGKHLVIACGGTGGHFFPTLAIAQAFVALGNRVTLMVAGAHSAEQLEIAAKFGLPAVEVPAVRGPQSVMDALLFPFRFLNCIWKAKSCLKQLRPDVMLGMGSYASVATCLARPSKVPLVLHEGNAFMGKANRMLARRASRIGLSLPLTYPEQCKGAVSRLVGMPLRQALLDAVIAPPQTGFLTSLGLVEGVPTVLVFGGSQGARAINELFTKLAPLLKDRAGHIQFLHLTGTDDNAALQEAYASAGVAASVRRADSQIQHCYQAASLVVCRGGASSLCELALFSKPAIIIPLPSAADDHQTVNARFAESIGGAKCLPQDQATPEAMRSLLVGFLEHPVRAAEMGRKLHQIARPDAANSMAALLAEVAQEAKT